MCRRKNKYYSTTNTTVLKQHTWVGKKIFKSCVFWVTKDIVFVYCCRQEWLAKLENVSLYVYVLIYVEQLEQHFSFKN